MTVGVETNQIIVRLKQRAQGKPGSRTARQRQEEAARNARVNKMLISMVVIFGTSWCPINLINLAADTVDLSSLSLNLLDKNCKRFISGCWELYYLAFFITHVIAMSSICYNPFLYGWMNTGIGIVVLAWVWFNINQKGFYLISIRQYPAGYPNAAMFTDNPDSCQRKSRSWTFLKQGQIAHTQLRSTERQKYSQS